ncbi:MAG: site-specific recombinase, invertase Pin [Sphingomonadales bacterium]|nr:site-specific recombinase, invertase Pin [Sphingomonadales bacterium]
MVIDWNRSETEMPSQRPLKRAAQYVRMSTEHQEHSTGNQSKAIRIYAEKRGYEIVRTYADEGKSGLSLVGRDALNQLLEDIKQGRADFDFLLVYDVSRFGRFQDPDEAAMYEIQCKRAGILILYCAEQFENDGTIGSSIIKTVKRVMAGEYSRELSVKVHAGQSHLIRLGFRQGGPAGFGLRRMLVDQSGFAKGQLARMEHKSIATDRVILVPGPDDETAIIRGIYHDFIVLDRTEHEIANGLNAHGVLSESGRRWTRRLIQEILKNEKYIGHNVWSRTSFKLKREHVQNTPDAWVRADCAFTPIVSPKIFRRAQEIIAARSVRLSDEEVLDKLRAVLALKGSLTELIINQAKDCPSSKVFKYRFGSMLRAYALIGYSPNHDYRYIKVIPMLCTMHTIVMQEILHGLLASGSRVIQKPLTSMLLVNDEITVAVVIARCQVTSTRPARWQIRLDAVRKWDLTIVVRMDRNNQHPQDYYLLPHLDMHGSVLCMAQHNGLPLDAYRVDSLVSFYDLTTRSTWLKAA